jgi:hypothetical protein
MLEQRRLGCRTAPEQSGGNKPREHKKYEKQKPARLHGQF